MTGGCLCALPPCNTAGRNARGGGVGRHSMTCRRRYNTVHDKTQMSNSVPFPITPQYSPISAPLFPIIPHYSLQFPDKPNRHALSLTGPLE